MCDQQFRMHWMSEAPLVGRITLNGSLHYHGVIYEIFQSAFKSCCNRELLFDNEPYPNQMEMLRTLTNMSIAMPVSYTSRMATSDVGIFLRVVDSSGLAFVSQVPQPPEGNLLTQGIGTVWPLVVLIILTCGYVGILFWLAEFTVKAKKRQIARSFFSGLFDGYWCAFITVTTVGYGDKVTGAKAGKLLTIIWLLCGLGIMAAFTAAMTNLMTTSADEITSPVSMKTCDVVGVMNGSVAQQLIVEAGLRPYIAKSFEELHDLLENETIEGFAVGQYYCAYHLNQISEQYMISFGQSEPITSGIIFNAFCEGCDALRTCLKRYFFVRSLDLTYDLQHMLRHRKDDRPSPYEAATLALGKDQMYLAYMAIVLGILVFIAWTIDFLIRRHLERKRSKKSDEEVPMQESNGKN